MLAALTGPLAFYGSAVAKGLEMLSASVNKQGGVNGRPIKFVILDQQSNPQVAAQLMSQQIAKGAQIVMDAGGGSSCLGAQSQLQANGPVLYCMTPVVHPPQGSYTFVATTPGFYDQYAVIVRYFRLRGFTKIGLISSTDATGQESERLVDQIAQLPENKGLTITTHERMALSDLSGDGADRAHQGRRRAGDHRRHDRHGIPDDLARHARRRAGGSHRRLRRQPLLSTDGSVRVEPSQERRPGPRAYPSTRAIGSPAPPRCARSSTSSGTS